MRTVTLKIRKEYAIKLLEDLERSAAISLVHVEKESALRKKRFTKKEVTERALQSEKAIREKRFISIKDLEKEMKNW